MVKRNCLSHFLKAKGDLFSALALAAVLTQKIFSLQSERMKKTSRYLHFRNQNHWICGASHKKMTEITMKGGGCWLIFYRLTTRWIESLQLAFRTVSAELRCLLLDSFGYMSCNGGSRVTEVEVSWGTRRRLSKGPLHSSTMLSGSYRTLMVNDLNGVEEVLQEESRIRNWKETQCNCLSMVVCVQE